MRWQGLPSVACASSRGLVLDLACALLRFGCTLIYALLDSVGAGSRSLFYAMTGRSCSLLGCIGRLLPRVLQILTGALSEGGGSEQGTRTEYKRSGEDESFHPFIPAHTGLIVRPRR